MKNTIFKLLVNGILAVTVGYCAGAMAEDDPNPNRNLVSFTVSAEEEVANDLLVVRLFSEHESAHQHQAATQVNADMQWALKLVKEVSAIKSQTLDYRSNPIYDKRTIKAWRLRQSLSLESADHDAVTSLLGQLQKRLAIESVSYRVSPAVRKEAEGRLVDKALHQMTSRAEQVTKSLGRASYELVSVNISSGGGRPPPIAYAGRALAMSAEKAAPSIESGEQTLSAQVNATIELAKP